MITRDWIMEQIVETNARLKVLNDMLRSLDGRDRVKPKTATVRSRFVRPQVAATVAAPSANGPAEEPEADPISYPSGFWVGQKVRYNPPRGETPKYPANGLPLGTWLEVIDPRDGTPEDGVWVTDGGGEAMIDAMCLHEA